MATSGGQTTRMSAAAQLVYRKQGQEGGRIRRYLTAQMICFPEFPVHFEGYSCQLDRFLKVGGKLTRVKLERFVIKIFLFKVLEFTKT